MTEVSSALSSPLGITRESTSVFSSNPDFRTVDLAHSEIDIAKRFVARANELFDAGLLATLIWDIPREETSRVMMRVYSLIASCRSILNEVNELHNSLPLQAKSDLDGTQLPLRETLYALLVRSTPAAERGLSKEEYDILTLPWRCRFGSLRSDDDNDVCNNAFIEWQARRLQVSNSTLSREDARVQAFLESAI